VTSSVLTMWTIYENPKDYPGKWVVRAHRVGAGIVMPHTECVVTESLEAARRAVPIGLIRLDRTPKDDPVIVEIWL
jgi:hypothetical protein